MPLPRMEPTTRATSRLSGSLLCNRLRALTGFVNGAVPDSSGVWVMAMRVVSKGCC